MTPFEPDQVTFALVAVLLAEAIGIVVGYGMRGVIERRRLYRKLGSEPFLYFKRETTYGTDPAAHLETDVAWIDPGKRGAED